MKNRNLPDIAQTARRLKWWQTALITVAVSILGSLSTLSSRKREKKLYHTDLKQAPWAPPSWVFGPAWMVNNFFLILALQQILAEKVPQKNRLLILQLFIWTVYFSFGFVYFRKKSPVLAALWTMTDTALAVASFMIARKSGAKLASKYVPLMLWGGFASTLADYQALKNPDPLLNSRPLLN